MLPASQKLHLFPCSLHFRLVFPCSTEINDNIPVPHNPWEGLIICVTLPFIIYNLYLRYWDRQTCTNSKDPDQTPHLRRLIRVFIVCHSPSRVWVLSHQQVKKWVFHFLGQVWYKELSPNTIPAGTWRLYNVALTSLQREHRSNATWRLCNVA